MVLRPLYRALGRVVAEHLAARGWAHPRTNLVIAWRKLNQGNVEAALAFLERFVASTMSGPPWREVHHHRQNPDPGPWLMGAVRAYQEQREQLEEFLVLVEALRMELRVASQAHPDGMAAYRRCLQEICLALGVVVTDHSVLTPGQYLEEVLRRMAWWERMVFLTTNRMPRRLWTGAKEAPTGT